MRHCRTGIQFPILSAIKDLFRYYLGSVRDHRTDQELPLTRSYRLPGATAYEELPLTRSYRLRGATAYEELPLTRSYR